MQDLQQKYREDVQLGWVNALQLVVIMFLVSVTRSAIANDFSGFGKDPGNTGLDIMIVIFAIYALLPVMVRIFDGRIFRWFMVGAGVFFLLMFIAHQLTHMYVDKMPLSIYHVLDFAHHGLMIWITYSSVRWALLAPGKGAPSASASAPAGEQGFSANPRTA